MVYFGVLEVDDSFRISVRTALDMCCTGDRDCVPGSMLVPLESTRRMNGRWWGICSESESQARPSLFEHGSPSARLVQKCHVETSSITLGRSENMTCLRSSPDPIDSSLFCCNLGRCLALYRNCPFRLSSLLRMKTWESWQQLLEDVTSACCLFRLVQVTMNPHARVFMPHPGSGGRFDSNQ